MTKKKKQPKKLKQSKSSTSTIGKNKVNYSLWIYGGLLFFFMAFMLTIQSAYVDFGLDRDEGSYINFGEVLREGGKMYKDIYSIKPPAIFYLYAGINTLFGYSAEGLRTSVIVFQILSSILLFFFAYRQKNAFFAGITSMAYLLFTFNPYTFGFAALTEQYQNLFLILSAVLLQQGIIKKDNKWYLISGIVFAFGVLIKQNLLFAFVAMSVGLSWYFIIESKARNWKPLLCFLGASAATVLLCYLPVLLQGTWSDMIYWNFTYSSLYTTAIEWADGQNLLKSFFKMTTQFNFWMWVVGAIGVLLAIIRMKSIAGKIAIALVFLACVLSIFPGLRFYPHYWIYLAPVLAVGFGWTALTLSDILSRFIQPQLSQLILVALFFGGVYQVKQANPKFLDQPAELFVNRRLYGDNPFTETRILGEYLGRQMSESDELLMFGSEPEVYVYAERTPPTPYIFFTHLDRRHERQQAMIADFKQWAIENQPEYVYFSNHPFSWGVTPETDQSFYQWCYQFVHSNYETIGVADIHSVGQPATILLGDQAASYQTQSQKWVKIYRRSNN